MGETRICPACGKEYHERPALSRIDSKTEICPDCGMAEALGDMIMAKILVGEPFEWRKKPITEDWEKHKNKRVKE